MKRAVLIEHVSIELKSSFEHFTGQFEKALGILMPSALPALEAAPASMGPYLNSTRHEVNLVIYNITSQEDLTKKESNKKIKQYQVGNPEIMRRMTDDQTAAGLYIPIPLLVYETAQGNVMIEYDRPSSQCAQFNNAALLADSLLLETKLLALIKLADNGID